MPFVIRCFIALGILCIFIAKLINMMYKKEINAAIVLKKEIECTPLLISGLFVFGFWVCFLVALLWAIFSIGA